MLAAYNYAVGIKQRGVNIVALNASFGGPSFSASEQSAIEALRDAGIVLCAAACNETTDNDVTPSYPANYPTSNINPHFPALRSSPRLRQAGRSDPLALSGASRRKQIPSPGFLH